MKDEAPIEGMPAGLATGLFLLFLGLFGWGLHSAWWMIAAGAGSVIAAIGKQIERSEDRQSSSAHQARSGGLVIDVDLLDDAAQAETDYETISDDPRWFEGEKGKYASFTYVDVDGVITDRRVRNWRSSGPYVYAVCEAVRSSRTFRKDRIADWQSNNETTYERA